VEAAWPAWISHAAGQGLIAYALAQLPAAFTSVGLLLQPVIAALFAWLLLAEPLSALQVAGGAIVLTASCWPAAVRPRRHQKRRKRSIVRLAPSYFAAEHAALPRAFRGPLSMIEESPMDEVTRPHRQH